MIRFAFALAASIALELTWGLSLAAAQAPEPSLGAHDVFTEFKLPPVQDHTSDVVWRSTQRLQVMARARRLGLDAGSATEAWNAAEQTYRMARRALDAPAGAPSIEFNGSLASQLNAALTRPEVTAVKVTSIDLQIDTPILLNRSSVSLDLGAAKLRSALSEPYMIEVEQAQDVHLTGGELASGSWGVLVDHSSNVTITEMNIHDLSGGGMMIRDSEDVSVWRNELHALRASPMVLTGETQRVTVYDNEIFRNVGPSNWHAGILLTDRNVDLATTYSELSGSPQFSQPMSERLKVPHDNLIAYNHVFENRSSGIYSDGSIRNVIVGNRVERNSKEGMCLDDGSIADVVAWNLFRGNGKRWASTDPELTEDFVLQLGRLPDGSSPAKLPGISIDNAAYNEVLFNQVDGNFGGGVKMVRTGVYNVIGLNLLTDDNEGQNDRFHFFGIELGAATLDVPSVELNGGPSRGNIVFGNTIRGTHFAGIFFAEGSDRNNVFDNSIFGATNWAMESVRVQRNYVLNNLTNLRSRNVSSGLDPALLKLGAGVFDKPPRAPATGDTH